jgi:hypothetical protein
LVVLQRYSFIEFLKVCVCFTSNIVLCCCPVHFTISIFGYNSDFNTKILKHHTSHNPFLAKANLIVAAFIPLKRDAIDELGLSLAKLNVLFLSFLCGNL